MTQTWKRSISMLLALVMVFGMVPTIAFAEGEDVEEQSYMEEPITEEPAVEEPVAEEPSEDSATEAPAAAESEQPGDDVALQATAYVARAFAMKADVDETLDGYVWLYGDLINEEDKVQNYILENGLKDMILGSLLNKIDVVYDSLVFPYEYEYLGESGTEDVSMNAPSWTMSAVEYAAWSYLADEVKAGGNVSFRLKKGDNYVGDPIDIGFRSVNKVTIKINPNTQMIAKDAFDGDDVAAAAAVYAPDKESISITYEDGEILPLAAAKVVITPVTGDDWPRDGAETTVNPFVKVTIADSLDGTVCEEETATLTLKDTTPVYTVQYDLGNGTVIAAEPYAAGVATPSYEFIKGVAPARQYYNFVKWSPAVAETIVAPDEGDKITYTADWNPINDVNNNGKGNGIADEEELFTIIYRYNVLDENGKVVVKEESFTANAGQPTPTIAEPKAYKVIEDGVEKEYKFHKWDPIPSKTVAATVDDSATVYTAEWTTKHRVYFFMSNHKDADISIVTDGEKVAAQQSFDPETYQISTGIWYYANANGDYTDAKGNLVTEENKVEFNFWKTPVTSDLYLVTDWNSDHNDNGIVDGALPDGVEDGDPITYHIYYDIEGKEIKRIPQVENDLFYKKADIHCNEYKPEGVYFDGWELNITKHLYEGDDQNVPKDYVASTDYEYTPKDPVPDLNGNTIDDNLETITIISEGNGTVTAKATNLFDAGNGTYLYDSRKGYEYCRNITITATPVVTNKVSESYVSEIQVNGESVDLESKNFNSGYAYTYTVTDAAKVDTVKHIFADAALPKVEVEKQTALEFKTGYTPVNPYKIYRTAVSVMPGVTDEETEYNSNVTSMKYLARDGGEASISVKGIEDSINAFALPPAAESFISASKFEELKKDAISTLYERTENGNGYLKVTLDPVWLTIGEPITAVSMDQVAAEAEAEVMNSIMNSVMKNPSTAANNMKQFMKDALDQYENTINAKARMANCHPFGYNTGESRYKTENLEIIYENAAMRIVEQNVLVKLDDPRTATKITANNVTAGFGADLSGAKLLELSKAKLTTLEGKEIDGLELAEDYTGKIPGSYTVFLNYAGDENTYKPAEAKNFVLTVQSSAFEISVSDVISANFNTIKSKAKPVIKQAGSNVDVEFDAITGLQLIVGYDMDLANTFDFAGNGKVSDVNATAYLKLSPKLKSLLNSGEFDISYQQYLKQGTHPLGNMTAVITEIGSYMGKDLSKLNAVLTMFADDPDINLQVVEVCEGDDVYPSNPGVYLNVLAVVDDGNYTVKTIGRTLGSYEGIEMTYGFIGYHPTIYLPNNGIELTYAGKAGNKVEVPSNGKLTVERNGQVLQPEEYSMFYVGMAGDGKDYVGAGAPTKDGIYMVSVVDLNTTGKTISTDCAIVTIGMKQGQIDIDGLTRVTEKPNVKQYPDIQVSDGAAVTVISATAGIKGLNTDMGAEEMIQHFYGTVHVEIPNVIYSRLSEDWAKAAKYLESIPDKMPTTVTRDDLIKVLNKIQDINEGVVNTTLGIFQSSRYSNGKVESYVEKALLYVNGWYKTLADLVGKLPENLSISFSSQRMGYSAAGLYGYIGIVTDPAFIPAVDAGLMMIENGETFRLVSAEIPYDGSNHDLELIDKIGQGSITVIRGTREEKDHFNFLLGEHESAVVDKLQQWSNKTLKKGEAYQVTVEELYGAGENVADALAEAIITAMTPKMQDLVTEKFNGRGGNAVQEAMDNLENVLIPQAIAYLSEKLQENDGLGSKQDAVITINGNKPVEIGEYRFYAASYGIAFSEGTLKIVPAKFGNVSAMDLTYNGEEQEVTLTVTNAKGEVLEEGTHYEIISGNKGRDAGTYTVTIKGIGCYEGTSTIDWKINKANVTVTAASDCVTYGEEIPSVALTYSNEQAKTELNIQTAWKAVKGSNADTYGTDYNSTAVYKNWIVTYVDGELEIIARKITSVTAEDRNYTGKEQTTALTVLADGVEVPEEMYTVTGNIGTDAKTYVVVVASNNPNFTGSATTTWKINAKQVNTDIKAELDKTSVPYNGEEQSVTVTVTNGDGDELKLGKDYTIEGITKAEDVGKYTVKVNFCGNYTGTRELTWTIEKAKLTIVATGEKFYGEKDPTEPTITVTSDDIVVNEDLIKALAIKVARHNTNENAGDYNYTVTWTENTNYEVSVDTQNSVLTIKPAQVVVIIHDKEMKASDEVPELTWVQDTAENNEIVQGKVSNEALQINLSHNIATNEFGQYLEGVYDITGAYKESDNWVVTFVNEKNPAKTTGTLTVTEGDYICWNPDTGVYYDDVSDALMANSGELEMLKNATFENGKNESLIWVGADDTLNLNGFYVEADNLFSFGNVIDETEGTGGLLISNNKTKAFTQLQATNTYLPIYDVTNGCYRFVYYELAANGYTKISNDSIRFKFKLKLNSVDAYKLLAETADSGLTVCVKLNWTGLGKDIIYTMSVDTIREYGALMYDDMIAGNTTAMQPRASSYLTVGGLSKLVSDNEISARPFIVSATDVMQQTADQIVYQVP